MTQIEKIQPFFFEKILIQKIWVWDLYIQTYLYIQTKLCNTYFLPYNIKNPEISV